MAGDVRAATATSEAGKSGAKGALIRPADVLPAYLYGPGHCSLKYGLGIGGALAVDRPGYRDGAVTQEIRRTNSKEMRRKFGDASSDTVRHWLTEKGAENVAVAYRSKFGAKKRLFKEQELVGAFDAYRTRRDEEGKSKYQARWKAVFALQKLVERARDGPLGEAPVRLAGGDRALYEVMFRAEPRKHVSRSSFLTAMRRVYGFQIAPLAGHVDRPALHTLGEVYSAFDGGRRGGMDWRCMLFMLRVAVNAQATVETNLKWGFALFSSPGSFDTDCNDPVAMDDFKTLVYTMARFEKVDELGRVFDDAWKAVASEDAEAGRLAEAAGARPEETTRKPLQVNMRLLTMMLRQRPLKDMLRPARRFGLRDRGTWTYAIEEAFFDPLLLALVKRKRRDKRNEVATSIFLSNTHRRTVLVRMEMWKRLVRRRKHCVRLMMSIGGKFFRGNSSSAFRAIQRRAIACKACETIQRVYRGYQGRLVAEFVRRLVRRVIKAQAAYRGATERRKFLSWMKTKHLAATGLQRIVRGTLGRKRARCMLQEHFDREMAIVDAEVERLEYRNRHKASSKLQRLWRTRRSLRKAEEEKQRRIVVQEAEAEMKQVLDQEDREAQVYKRELAEWFKEQRKTQEQTRMMEEHTAQEKFKILCYRRRERDRVAAEAKRRRVAAAEKLEEQRIEQWLKDWAEKAEERAIAHRKMLEAVLAHPDNEPEKALQKSLEAEIEAQKKAVLKMADNVEADLEAPEALSIAKSDVFKSKMDEERQRVNEEMKVAAAKYEEEEARVKADKEEKMSKLRDSAADAAARVIQQMYYVFSATQLTQKRAKDVYTKHFDAQYLAYYWYNTQIGTYLWEKPPGLGDWDVDPEDRWEIIAGAYDLQYYYNPKTYVMQWSKPAGAVVCEECDVQFSTRWCTRDARPYCEECYRRRHFNEDKPSTEMLAYKELDGAVPGSLDLITYDEIADLPEIAVETWPTEEEQEAFQRAAAAALALESAPPAGGELAAPALEEAPAEAAGGGGAAGGAATLLALEAPPEPQPPPTSSSLVIVIPSEDDDFNSTDTSAARQLAVVVPWVGAVQDVETPSFSLEASASMRSSMAEEAGVLIGGGGQGSAGPEIEEYLESQEAFSYDDPEAAAADHHNKNSNNSISRADIEQNHSGNGVFLVDRGMSSKGGDTGLGTPVSAQAFVAAGDGAYDPATPFFGLDEVGENPPV